MSKAELESLHQYLNKVRFFPHFQCLEQRNYPALGKLFSVQAKEASQTLRSVQRILQDSVKSQQKLLAKEEEFAKSNYDRKAVVRKYEALKEKYQRSKNRNGSKTNQISQLEEKLKRQIRDKNR